VRISGERTSGGKAGAGEGLPSGGLPAPLIAPPPPKEWCYRDLEGKVQGPFSEEQISEWFRLAYLPANLQMRCTDDPPDAYIPLQGMGAQPPFVRAHLARQRYTAELERRQRDQKVRAATRATRSIPRRVGSAGQHSGERCRGCRIAKKSLECKDATLRAVPSLLPLSFPPC
jgi:hypothetical protein